MPTIRLVPSVSAVSNATYATIADASNMYTNTDSTTHGTFTHTRASTSNTYYGYLRGFNFSSVPSNAKVNSFTVKIKASATGHTTSTSTSYYMTLCNNTTSISGTNASGRLTTTTTTFTFAIPTTLTWDTIKGYGTNGANFTIRIPMRRANSNTEDVVSVYGAEIEVDYSLPVTVTSTLSGNGTIVPSGASSVYNGDTYNLTITPTNASDTVTATKDGTSITLTEHTGGTIERYPATYSNGGSVNGTRYQNTIGHSVANPSSSTGSDYFSTTSGGSGSTWIEYGFDFSEIPTTATINSVSVQVRGHAEDISQSRQIATVQLYSGSTTKGSPIDFTSNSDANYTLSDVGTWTATELQSAKLRFTIGVYGGLITGVTWTVNYTTSKFYTYSYTVNGDATIAVTIGTVTPVAVTGVSLDHNTASIEAESTYQLTATVAPSNATDKRVTWSSSNTSVATVSSSGLVTAVSAGSATITVTTTDGGYTDTCAVTVTPVVLNVYIPATTMEVGTDYLIVNGNTGTVYMMSNQSGGSRTLVGVQTTVTDGKISIRPSVAANCLFTCELYTQNDPLTTCLSNNSQYLYCDNASGLRMYSSPNNKHWHYKGDAQKFWLFRGTTDGYDDATSEYKYYLQWDNSGNFTDNHVTTTSIENSTLPAIYLFKLDDGSADADVYQKQNGAYVYASEVYKKVNGSWVLQSNMALVFDNNTHYKSV